MFQVRGVTRGDWRPPEASVICTICEDVKSERFCVDCDATFCLECFADVHSSRGTTFLQSVGESITAIEIITPADSLPFVDKSTHTFQQISEDITRKIRHQFDWPSHRQVESGVSLIDASSRAREAIDRKQPLTLTPLPMVGSVVSHAMHGTSKSYINSRKRIRLPVQSNCCRGALLLKDPSRTN